MLICINLKFYIHSVMMVNLFINNNNIINQNIFILLSCLFLDCATKEGRGSLTDAESVNKFPGPGGYFTIWRDTIINFS